MGRLGEQVRALALALALRFPCGANDGAQGAVPAPSSCPPELPGTNRKQMKITRQEAGLSAAAWRKRNCYLAGLTPSTSYYLHAPHSLSTKLTAHLQSTTLRNADGTHPSSALPPSMAPHCLQDYVLGPSDHGFILTLGTPWHPTPLDAASVSMFLRMCTGHSLCWNAFPSY